MLRLALVLALGVSMLGATSTLVLSVQEEASMLALEVPTLEETSTPVLGASMPEGMPPLAPSGLVVMPALEQLDLGASGLALAV